MAGDGVAEVVSGPRAVEVDHGVVEGAAHGLGDHLGQLEVVDLLGPHQVELGTRGAAELSLVLVLLGQGEDEQEALHHVPATSHQHFLCLSF